MPEGRREKRLRKDAERRAAARLRGEGGGRLEDLATRPVATGLILAAAAVVFIVQAASNLTALELGAIVGDPGSSTGATSPRRSSSWTPATCSPAGSRS